MITRRQSSFTPGRVTFVAGLIAGVLLLFVAPPTHAPDEPQHFFRAFEISEGKLRPEGKFVIPSSFELMLDGTLQGIQGSPELTLYRDRLASEWVRPLNGSRRVEVDRTAETAGWIGYLPQAAGITIAHLMTEPSPVGLVVAARTANFITCLILVTAAVSLMRTGGNAFALLALTPMQLFLRITALPDAFVASLALLFAAAVCRAREVPLSRPALITALGCGLVAAWADPTLTPLLLLMILPASAHRSTWTISAAVAGLAGAIAIWLDGAAARTAADGATALVQRFVGVFGWNDTPLDWWFVGVWLAALAAAAVFEPPQQLSWRERLVIGAAVVLAMANTAAASLVSWMAVAPLIILIAGSSRVVRPIPPPALISASALSIIATVAAIVGRFYG